MSRRDHVAALKKGLEVLACFDRQHGRLTVSQTAVLSESSPASARRALLTLQAMGYLDSDGKHFWMAAKSLSVAHAYLASRPMPSLAQPLLDALSESTRESASLAELLQGDAIVIARSTARRSLSVGLGIGARLPGYCSALGRVLLASLPPAIAEEWLRTAARPALTARTVTEVDALLQMLKRCRHDGYSENDGELELGVRSMAVPVCNRAGTTVAAMSIAVRAERMEASDFREAFLPKLRRASGNLSIQLWPR